MIRLGLTGGIGSGKSTVAQMFADLGATVIDADAIARELLSPGSQLLKKVAAEFGDRVLDDQGQLRRAVLADIIFTDFAARQKLNRLMHPAVRQRAADLAQQAAGEAAPLGVVVEDIPLLVETDQLERFDHIVVVFANLKVRLQRLKEQRGMSPTAALARIDAQASDEQRAAAATWIIDNSGSLVSAQVQVDDIWRLVTAAE
ncbi:MAG: dephospho-CoA kinase [Rothia sp. (in: high G+C Gram-positive bacteria)]|nr:dephospho-CoA kinase [Rothia sp. (in: high G+C Gram-positive bacteria)]